MSPTLTTNPIQSTSPTSSTATPPSARGQRPHWKLWWRSNRVPAIFFAAILLIAVLAGYFSTTSVSGLELNCQTWQVRRFSFRRDPFTNYQFTSLSHSASYSSGLWTENASKTASSIDSTIAQELVSQAPNSNRWDLIRIQDGSPRTGPAAVLYELLKATNHDYNNYWLAWTSDHPKHAQLLWPAAHELVAFECYADLPELFELATKLPELDDFGVEVDSLVQASLLRFCQQSDDSTMIRSAAATALARGDHPELQQFVDSESSLER